MTVTSFVCNHRMDCPGDIERGVDCLCHCHAEPSPTPNVGIRTSRACPASHKSTVDLSYCACEAIAAEIREAVADALLCHTHKGLDGGRMNKQYCSLCVEDNKRSAVDAALEKAANLHAESHEPDGETCYCPAADFADEIRALKSSDRAGAPT